MKSAKKAVITVKAKTDKTDVSYDVVVHMEVSYRGLQMARVALLNVLSDGLCVVALSKSMREAKMHAWLGEQNGWRTSLEDALVFKTPCKDHFSGHIASVRGDKKKIELMSTEQFQARVRKRRLAESI